MRTTIRDVAREAGVSVTTVSHALNGYSDVNENTRRRILNVAKRLDYVPNENGRALGGMPAKTLALLFVGEMQPTDPSGFIFGIISGVYAAAQETGYDFVILTASEKKQNETTFLQLCRQKNVSGVVVYGMAESSVYYSQIENSPFPCVQIDVKLKGKMNRMVSVDNVRAVKEVVSYMIEQGFCHIGLLGGSREAQVAQWRERGYRQALQEHGLSVREEWIEDCRFLTDNAEQRAMELKHAYPEIDAFFCASDHIAIGAVEGLQKLGYRVPEDVGIAGFDDMLIMKYIHGGITSVAQKPYEMGKAAANAVLKLINGEEVSEWIEVNYEIHKRRSTVYVPG